MLNGVIVLIINFIVDFETSCVSEFLFVFGLRDFFKFIFVALIFRDRILSFPDNSKDREKIIHLKVDQNWSITVLNI